MFEGPELKLFEHLSGAFKVSKGWDFTVFSASLRALTPNSTDSKVPYHLPRYTI